MPTPSDPIQPTAGPLGPVVGLAQRPANSLVAISQGGGSQGEGGAITLEQLVALVLNIRVLIAQQRLEQPVLACADRLRLLACVLACRAEGCVPVLPPNVHPDTLRALLDREQADGLIHDGSAQAGLDVGQLAADRTARDSDVEACVRLLVRDRARPFVHIFSSGSTGEPSVSTKTGQQLLGEAEFLAQTFGVGASARVISSVPAHHIYGLLFGVLVPLLGGGAFFTDAPSFGRSLGESIREGRANVLCSVPPHLHGMQVLDRTDVATLERVFCSGARLPSEDAAALRVGLGLEVTEVLGSTETGGMAWRLASQAPAWTPLPGVQITADEQGTLLVDSPFLGDGCERPHRTKDSIRMLDATRFEHIARTDSIVKVGGERVSLAEVEQHLRSVPGVRDATVLAVDDPGPRQSQIWAVVAGAELAPQEIRRSLAGRLDAVAVPRRIACVDSLPREATGKLQREVLLGLFAEGGGPQLDPSSGRGA